MIFGGWWSDKVGRKISMLVPSVVLIIWAPVFFSLVGMKSVTMLGIAVIVGAFFHGVLAGPEAAWITELFPARYRYGGSSLVFGGSSIIAGAPAPLIALWLQTRFGNASVIAYLVITMAITIIALMTSRETKGRDLAHTTKGVYEA
ncbi:hypothetical protein GCM10027418_29970 [Mariniluteicoccus endophyticus]